MCRVAKQFQKDGEPAYAKVIFALEPGLVGVERAMTMLLFGRYVLEVLLPARRSAKFCPCAHEAAGPCTPILCVIWCTQHTTMRPPHRCTRSSSASSWSH